MPTPASDLYKVAVHHGGPTIDPDEDFAPDPVAVGSLRAAIARWLPAAELVEVDVCPYDNTSDESFIVSRRDAIHARPDDVPAERGRPRPSLTRLETDRW